MDVIALMVIGSLVATGLITPPDAVAGFSNGAVVATWAMFILSNAMTRAGISKMIGYSVLRLAGRHEVRMIVMTMLTDGTLSFFMNNIGVAALMLPVVVDVARRTRIPASRLLIPLTYGTLLGGLTTLVGTPANLLLHEALLSAGFRGFGVFDFVPLGGSLVIAGVLFVALLGRHLLPRRKLEDETHRRSQRNLRMQCGLPARNFEARGADDSILVGETLAQSRIGSAAGLLALAPGRRGRTELMPSRQPVLQGGDKLSVQGRLDRFREFQRWSELVIEREEPVLQGLMAGQVAFVEVTIDEGSALVGAL